MEEIIETFSEMCFDLSEEIRKDCESNKKRDLLLVHLNKASKLAENIRIPDFRPGLEWLNVTESLSLHSHLKGKIVILDFFTYCCINCMHILPDLKRLEEEFSVEDGLVVVGVHSAKFENERITSNIEDAIRRYEVTHPVVNDDFEGMWGNLGINCWPTLYVLGPNGEPLLLLQGEGHYDTLRVFIREALGFFNEKGCLSKTKIPVVCGYRAVTISDHILSYPGKVSIDSKGELLAVSDTGHHRILIITTQGKVVEEIGGPNAGFSDGDFSKAKFWSPQGTTFWDDEKLFVADTENHAIREIDLKLKRVTTLVGGRGQGLDFVVGGGETTVEQPVSSPWDVAPLRQSNALLIAMAGTHQVWAHFFGGASLWKRSHPIGCTAAVIGSGREENRSTSYPNSSGLAQPSGLSVGPEELFIADSESSTIRSVSLATGAVTNLVGGSRDPRDLFSFGDKDGVGLEARLQHPLGVAWSPFDGCVYVADSYNHKIKRIDTKTKKCSTLQLPKLSEPGGLCAHGNKLYIADTNSHSIKVLHLETGKLEKVDVQYSSRIKVSVPTIEPKTVAINTEGGELHVTIEVNLPNTLKLTPNAPSRWSVNLPGGRTITSDGNFTLTPEWRIQLRKEDFAEAPASEEGRLLFKCRLFICTLAKCAVEELSFPVRVEFQDSAPAEAKLLITHNVAAPPPPQSNTVEV